MIHPTAAGATASIALVLVWLTHGLRLGGLSFTSTLVFSAIHVSVLLMANSRTAIAIACLTLPLAFLFYASKRGRGWAAAMFSAAIVGLIVIDPGFESVNGVIQSMESFLRRGQSNAQITQLSGRAEMWQAVWDQFLLSPVIGHGYFVSSAEGTLYVWGHFANHTAHNIFLQVLVSNGVIGLCLFLPAMISLLGANLRLFRHDQTSRQIAGIAFFMFVWFAIWSQTCITFIGPLRPECVVFFVLYGLVIGRVCWVQRPHQDDSIDLPDASEAMEGTVS